MPIEKYRLRSTIFVALSLLCWFLSDMAWVRIDFPFNWLGFAVFGGLVLGGLWVANFSAWGLCVLTVFAVALDPGVLVQFLNVEVVRNSWFYLNLLLSVVDVAWVALVIALLATLRLNIGVRLLFMIPFIFLLGYMILFSHYRWI